MNVEQLVDIVTREVMNYLQASTAAKRVCVLPGEESRAFVQALETGFSVECSENYEHCDYVVVPRSMLEALSNGAATNAGNCVSAPAVAPGVASASLKAEACLCAPEAEKGETLDLSHKRLVHEQDVRGRRKVQKVIVSRKAIITALAHDYCNKYQIEFVTV